MEPLRDVVDRCRSEAARVVVGQEAAIETALVAMIAGGHVLLEGVPGVAKTLIARLLARFVGGTYARIQFTPDLMPSDVAGTAVFDLETRTFHVRKGPVFANVVLADEINRAPAKTQSALLEAMQEAQVSIEGTTYDLPAPFVVLATQNPVEQEGTYPLPEASLDRFLFKVRIGYPEEEAEMEILERHDAGLHAVERLLPGVEAVLTAAVLEAARAEVARVHVEGALRRYVVRLVRGTRDAREVRLGASPRAAVALLAGARTLAAVRGRDFVTPDDVRDLAEPALVHRLVLDSGAELDGVTPEGVLERVVSQVAVPR